MIFQSFLAFLIAATVNVVFTDSEISDFFPAFETESVTETEPETATLPQPIILSELEITPAPFPPPVVKTAPAPRPETAPAPVPETAPAPVPAPAVVRTPVANRTGSVILATVIGIETSGNSVKYTLQYPSGNTDVITQPASDGTFKIAQYVSVLSYTDGTRGIKALQ